MGKARDKRKKQKGSAVAGKGSSKTEKKSEKNEDKKTRRIDKRLKDDGDDIDAILASIKLEEKERNKEELKIIDNCAPPFVRVHATYTPVTIKRSNIIVVFGGEYEDTKNDIIHMYKDLYFYNCEKNSWRNIVSLPSPSPRSSHQMVCYKDYLYMFGGEFTSPHQDRFKHFKDFWRFDLNINQWEDISAKKVPSKRSGHRMVVHNKKIYLFGGFYDTGDKVKYFNDLWVYDFEAMVWDTIENSKGPWPSPRSGFRMISFEDGIFIYGGYCKEKDDDDLEMEHGKILDDMWKFNIKLSKWERIKNVGILPGPRSGFNFVVHKGRAIYFGGATDNEAKKGETLISEFHNDLYQFNFDKNKWYTVNLRPLKSSNTLESQKKDDEKEVYEKAAVIIQSRYRGYAIRKAVKLYHIGGHQLEMIYSPASFGLDNSVKDQPKPRGRILPGLAIVKNTLWLFGGTVEILDKEIALDDIWCLDLVKYDGWKCIKENSAGDEIFEEIVELSSSESEFETEEKEEYSSQ